MEVVIVGVRNDDIIVLKDFEVEWKMNEIVDGLLLGDFFFNEKFFKIR